MNTYGAFGSITRERYEIVLEGTDEATVTERPKWREYEFKGKPGDPARRPPQVAPYHLRLDWLMWFDAMDNPENNPWFIRLLGEAARRRQNGDRSIEDQSVSGPAAALRAGAVLRLSLHDARRAKANRRVVAARTAGALRGAGVARQMSSKEGGTTGRVLTPGLYGSPPPLPPCSGFAVGNGPISCLSFLR